MNGGAWASRLLTDIKKQSELRYKGTRYVFGGGARWKIIALLYGSTDPDGWVELPKGSRSLGCFSDYNRDEKGGVDRKGEALRFKEEAIEPQYPGKANTSKLYRIRA